MSLLPARLWLVRHGQTDWNAAGRVQGHIPTDLNLEGRAQSLALGKLLADRPFAALYSSDLPRALQTSELLLQGAKLSVPIQSTEQLRERSFGPYEGATSPEIRAPRTALGLSSTGDLADWTGMPGIESNNALWSRIQATLKNISAQHSAQDVLVITHGGVIAQAINHILGIPEGTPRRYPLSNGIVAILQYRPDAWHMLSLIDVPLALNAQSFATIDTSIAPKS